MNHEITLKISGDIKVFCENLENKGFKKIDSFLLDDIFFIPRELNTSILSTREILSTAILIRSLVDDMVERKSIRLTFKNKKFAENGDILSQTQTNCEILEVEAGKKFLEAIGYKELMEIQERGTVYEKDGFHIEVKDIKNGDKLIEVELDYDNKEFNTIEKLKNKLAEFDLPLDTSNFYVKKAEIELNKILKK